ncbi:mitogen-activated protein kinase kinase kinase 14-like isoform X1 [Megalops cyprinoides]|uniref:mitogen-activated protein kinase kinase kinase 14-like isoform X1 n=1 Tax=Megalops cyprinoides TaxID=118141 RepID=UPI001863CC92|nr:mitogen-activated protein kinase kinase kinase 14-like isoform X1 [Megalops cyprinoides]XP_036408899.1 mitogen-activated protein kinase kinase kinase 14-like isoform X1 [Megalops cyprinoides]
MNKGRLFNSTHPWVEPLKAKGLVQGFPCSGKGMCGKVIGGKEDPLTYKIPPLVNRALKLGTAEDVASMQEFSEKLTFIAQPVCEGKQEFTPTCAERPFIGSPNCLNYRTSVEHSNVDCRAARMESRTGSRLYPRERHRTPSGVPEQESSSSLWLVHTQKEAPECFSASRGYSGCHSTGVQETERPGSTLMDLSQPSYAQEPAHSPSPSSTTHPWGSPGLGALSNICLYSQESRSDPHLSGVYTCSLALCGLKGSVCQEDRAFAGPFFKAVKKEERAKEEDQPGDADVNEGILFHPEEKLQPNDYEYKEGRDYAILHHIQNGTYGEVYSVQDKRTKFTCAAKKIPLKHFSSEEVGSWSALNSPRILELFGAVREGPHVILFMDLKSGSVGQLLRERGRLPEDLALHYHCQVLEALEHLQKRSVLHLDIKADNVLLSEDGKDTFLSDFGHSERLDPGRDSTSVYPGEGFQGTETHMAPEVVKGEPRSTKADVWSSCCMLLHMLNGCHPWTRYYTYPLCLKIATEPPPLREIPPDCRPHTADVIKAGLQKDPIKRASATELKEKTITALKEVGGLTSPVKGAYQEPAKAEPMESYGMHSRALPSPPAPLRPAPPPTDENTRSQGEFGRQWVGPGSEHSQLGEAKAKAKAEEIDADCLPSFPVPSLSPGTPNSRHQAGITRSVWEEEEKLEREFYLSSLSHLHSPELLLSCLSSDGHFQRDPQDKDSGHWSVSHSGDLSSGFFSYSSQADAHSFSLDWLGPTHLPPPNCFKGVDVYIQDFDGQCLRIREAPGVKVGHIATGISNQISESSFSLETEDGRPLSHDEEVLDSGLRLRCSPTPKGSRAWMWRVREGMLEMREPAV